MQESSRRSTSIWASSVLATLLLIGTPAVLPAADDVTTVKGSITFQGHPFPSDLSPSDTVVILHGEEKARTPTAKVTIDQRNRQFIPRVIAVAPGTTVEFPNNDTVHHNVRSRSSIQRFDLGLYPPGETRSVKLDKPGVIDIQCGAHHEMEAYIVVSDSPYFAVVGNGGSYRIDNVHPGKYEAEVWNPDVVPVRRPVNVRPNVPVLDINFNLRERKHAR